MHTMRLEGLAMHMMRLGGWPCTQCFARPVWKRLYVPLGLLMYGLFVVWSIRNFTFWQPLEALD